MASFLRDRMGASHRHVDDQAIDRVLCELDDARDDEHPDVSIEHESGWGLAAFQSGLLVWEYVEEAGEPRRQPRHMKDVSRDRVRELFRRVAADDLDSVEAQPWLPGYS